MAIIVLTILKLPINSITNPNPIYKRINGENIFQSGGQVNVKNMSSKT
jgi:hypothetical protein